MYRYFVIILVATFRQAVSRDGATDTCEYKNCPEFIPHKINAHIVPHSHNDVGWLRTADEYYNSAVRHILNSVFAGLLQDPKRRFTYVESFYFFKWWNKQSEAVRDQVRTLVKEGRLQFAGGGWSMNDEATTNYQSIIDQFTYGLNKINETFGPCATPRVAWQIDAFGHSREFASLLAAMGFHGQFLARIDYQDEVYRKGNESMDIVWRGDDSLGEDSDIYTGILRNMYWPPEGYCFDKLCQDEPIPDENAKRGKSNKFAFSMQLFESLITEMMQHVKTPIVLVTMGRDFHYQDSEKWFSNLDKIVRHFNKKDLGRSALKVFYSTPQCFLKAMRDTQCQNISEFDINRYRRKRETFKEMMQQDRNDARDRKFPPAKDDYYSYVRGQKFPAKHNKFRPMKEGDIPPNARHRMPPETQDDFPPNARHRMPPETQKYFPPNARHRMPPKTQDDFPPNARHGIPLKTQDDFPPNARHRIPLKTQDEFPPHMPLLMFNKKLGPRRFVPYQRDKDYIYAKMELEPIEHQMYSYSPKMPPPHGMDSIMMSDKDFKRLPMNRTMSMMGNMSSPSRRHPNDYDFEEGIPNSKEGDDFYSFVKNQKLPMKGNFTVPKGHWLPTDEYDNNSFQKDTKFPADKVDSHSYSRGRNFPMNLSVNDELYLQTKSLMFHFDDPFKDFDSNGPPTRFEDIEGNPKLPIKYDDFFPYASSIYAYWTAYYTSRPSLKYFERQGNTYLQMAKQLQVLGNLDKANMLVLDELKSAMGIMQHHEAITGTSKQNVTNDYIRRLSKAIEDASIIPRQALRHFTLGQDINASLSFTSCRLNESSCSVSETSNQFVVTVYNPLAWYVKEPIRIPVRDKDYEVFDHKGAVIDSQLSRIPDAVLNIPTRVSKATHEVIFIAELEPLSYFNYYVKWSPLKRRVSESAKKNYEETKESDESDLNVASIAKDIIWSTKNFKLRFNVITSKLMITLPDRVRSELNINYGYYISKKKTSKSPLQKASGAYILRTTAFRPENIDAKFGTGSTGDVVKEITIKTKKNVDSTLRVYEGLGFIENDWVIGPIPISDGQGKEYVVNYKTSINNKDEFYTDSNGRQLLKRKIGKRPQWNVTIIEQVAGNYYPVTNQISIEDTAKRFSVLTDRSEGGSSLQNGQIELMLHRRLLEDDDCGVEEALNETDSNGVGVVVRGQHRLIVSNNNKESILAEKKLVKEFNNRPQVFVSNAKNILLSEFKDFGNTNTFATLPEGLHLLTLEPWGKKLLIRLENYLDKKDRKYSTIQINLKNIFTNIEVQSFKETTLAANRFIEDWNHLSWINHKNGLANECEQVESKEQPLSFTVEIKPKQIRTFIIDYVIV